MIPKPLQYLENISKAYPDLWKYCNEKMSIIKDSFIWNDLCYCPTTIFENILSAYTEEKGMENYKADVSTFYCGLYNWKQYCQIYEFDPDFVNILIKSATDDVKLDDALTYLPFPAFYISINGENDFVISNDFIQKHYPDSSGGYVTGFFVHRNCSIHNRYNYNKSEEVNAVKFDIYLSGGASFSYEVMIGEGMTLRESFEFLRENHESVNMDLNSIQLVESAIEKAMVIILYLCAINIDISESKNQKKIRKSNINPNSKIAKETKKIKINEVGYTIGKAIRLSTDVEKNVETINSHTVTAHTAKRPHQRRAHFHTYWVGSEKDGSRHTELRWIHPIFVHLSNSETLTKITKVCK